MAFVVMLVVRDRETADGIAGGFEGTPVRPVGIFEYPNKDECQCSGNCTVKGSSPWRRHKRGHMTCVVCGFRHQATRRRLIGALFDYLGANLLSTPPATFRTPAGYGPEE